MKKVQKIIGISFFSLIAFTFLMLLVNDLIGMNLVIESFKDFGQNWGFILAWVLEIALCVTILVKFIMTLIGILQEKETDAKALVKKNLSLISLYFIFSALEEIFVLANLIQGVGEFDSAFASAIVLIIFQVIGAVITALACKQEKELMIKIFSGIAYAILLVTVILSLSSDYIKIVLIPFYLGAAYGSTALFTVFNVFMIFVTILGVFHALTYDVNFDKLLKTQEAPAAVEEQKEEKKEENSDAE